MMDFFNKMNMKFATIGNHEYDFGIDFMKSYMSSSKFDWVLDNVKNLTSNNYIFFPNQKKSQIIDIEGYKLGIITDGRPKGQRNKLEALNLRGIIDDIIITDELGGVQFRKPCDIAFRIMLTRWKLYPDEVVYVGDNPKKGFQAAKQLGMKSIWLKNKEQ